MGTWRRAYGALKDSTRVGLSKLSSEFKELDIAIVKATNHEECPPKERHVRKIFMATSVGRPRADIAYCIYALAKRLSKTRNWVVAVKTLIVIHRMLREGDPTFKEELLNYSHKGCILQISNFKDDSSPLAWDCSAWVRTYALFLEERLECFRVLKYDVEAEHLIRNRQSASKGHSISRTLSCPDLLEQMPALQQLLHRLLGCQPEGAAFGNYLIQHALTLVLKESFKIYCAVVNDGIMNLVDMFFEMTKYDAIKALEIYKRAGQQTENLSDFFDFCKHLELARNFQFPTLRQPPPSLLATMEEYIREAPCVNTIPNTYLDYQEKNLLTYKEDDVEETMNSERTTDDVEEVEKEFMGKEPLEIITDVEPLVTTMRDLLGVEDLRSMAAEIEQKNSLALAIVQPGDDLKAIMPSDLLSGDSGWELALVSTPSNNISNVAERKLAGGFDQLLLDSLYEDASRRREISGGMYHSPYHSNSYAPNDPFIASNSLTTLHQPQQLYYQHLQPQQFQYQQQQMSQFYPQQQHQHQRPAVMMVPYGYPQQPTNPFSVPFSGYPQTAPLQPNPSLI